MTVRDGNGDVAYSGPTIFLPTGPTFESFGVIKAPDARPGQIALEGTFYPTFALGDGLPRSVFGDAVNPLMSLFVYTGDLGLDDGGSQSVYVLDKSKAEQLMKDDGQPLRLDMRPGDTVELPDDLGTVTFDGIQRWNKLQISETPGKLRRPHGRRARPDRPPRVALHPAAPAVGAGPRGGRGHGRGRRRPRPLQRR